jgi:hypothetical protein
MKQSIAALFSLTLFIGTQIKSVYAEPIQAVFPKGEGRQQESSYTYQLLKLALEKSNLPYELKLSEQSMPEARARQLIAKNSDTVTVVFSGTSKEFEKQLNPVRIPLYGGLLGHRLFLIHKDQQENFNTVNSLNDLKNLTSGQGLNWSDIEILEASGLEVHTTKYPLLFRLLDKKRIDYFPRGASEIFGEYAQFKTNIPSLAIEQKLVLVYPFASFFFVSKENKVLHDAIYQGLEAAHKDGSFLNFFRNHPTTANVLSQANLAHRLRLDIPNPLMTEETLNIDKEYWFNSNWQ